MEYNIGDIIKLTNHSSLEYHIITDYEDFSEDMTDLHYQLIQIYPVSPVLATQYTSDKNFRIIAKRGSANADILHKFIKEERVKRGILGEPVYFDMINRNINSTEKFIKKISQKDESVIEERIKIDIEEITNIDDGLDLMNHLAFLAKILDRDDYLEVRELVKERLAELV